MDAQWPTFLNDLVGRLTGPLHLRFLLQPAMATFFGVRDGLKDARQGNAAYFWEMLTDSADRMQLVREGLKSVSKILILAIILDAIYQIVALHWFYIGQGLLVAVALAFVPYLLIRGPTNRIARWWASRSRHLSAGTGITHERNDPKTRQY